MKASVFKDVCTALGRAVESDSGRSFWEAMAEIADLAPETATVAKRFSVELGAHASLAAASADERWTVNDGIKASRPVLELLQVTAKPAVLKDLETAISFASAYGSLSPSALADASAAAIKEKSAKSNSSRSAAVDHEKCQAIAERLQALLGREEFVEAFAEVKGGKVAAVKEVARTFTGHPGKNKTEALDRIWRRHAAVLDEKKRQGHVGGRTAA